MIASLDCTLKARSTMVSWEEDLVLKAIGSLVHELSDDKIPRSYIDTKNSY